MSVLVFVSVSVLVFVPVPVLVFVPVCVARTRSALAFMVIRE